jgi:hypothetical protein
MFVTRRDPEATLEFVRRTLDLLLNHWAVFYTGAAPGTEVTLDEARSFFDFDFEISR